MYDFASHDQLLKTLLNCEIGNLSPKEKIYLGYSKANIYHQNKEYKKSSYFLKIANEEKLKIQPSDIKRKLNTGEYYRNLRIDRNPSIERITNNSRYLFIVGMPRCGLSLIHI